MNTNEVILFDQKKSKRKPMYENEFAESCGMIATCNSCDRIIFEDENDLENYQNSGGYCSNCRTEN